MTTSRDEFRALARTYRAIPVHRELLADLTTPLAAFMRCVGDERGFCLESVENGERWSRFSFVGRRPYATLVARGDRVTLTGSLPDDDLPLDRGVLAPLELLLDRYQAPRLADLPPLTAGLVGYLGYDVVREVERLPDMPPDDGHYPDAVLDVIGDMAVFDHWRQRVTLVSVALLGQDPTDVEIDETQFKQALLNLLVNARQVLKDGGTVTIRTRAGSRGEVVLEVEDDEPGIPEEMRERIFEVFYSSRGGGTGLGLPIARQIVERHGGAIELHSEEGQGTRFTIRLPRHHARFTTEPTPAASGT